jgi:hypothetical protein
MEAPHDATHHGRTVRGQRRPERHVFCEFPYTGQEQRALTGARHHPSTGHAHSRAGPPDHGLRAALRAVLSRAGGPATAGDCHTRAARPVARMHARRAARTAPCLAEQAPKRVAAAYDTRPKSSHRQSQALKPASANP